MTANPAAQEMARSVIASGERVDVFLTGRRGMRMIDGVVVEVVEDRARRHRRFRKLEKAGKAVWLLP